MRILSVVAFSSLFRYAFPFEGNWNPLFPTINQGLPGSDTLSRLKGIETEERTLKEITLKKSSDTLSRLKGIETRPLIVTLPSAAVVQIRFPVWRELKPKVTVWNNPPALACSDTLSRLKGIETYLPSWALLWGPWVQIRFPVWRELKQRYSPWTDGRALVFRYAFPFEGNWNAVAPPPGK